MKLIKNIDPDGSEITINPKYVIDVKVVHSKYNNDWCIDINIFGWTKPYTILCATKEECDVKHYEILSCMESVQ